MGKLSKLLNSNIQGHPRIRVIMVDDKNWFVGEDVARALLWYHPLNALSAYVDKSDCIEGNVTDVNGEDHLETLINESGLCSLICNAHVTENAKHKFLELFKEQGLVSKEAHFMSYRKHKFIDSVQTILLTAKIHSESQYNISDYCIDLYIPELQIAIEYDESDCMDKSLSSAQKEIEKELKCKFLKLNSRDTDEINIGLVVKEIINLK